MRNVKAFLGQAIGSATATRAAGPGLGLPSRCNPMGHGARRFRRGALESPGRSDNGAEVAPWRRK